MTPKSYLPDYREYYEERQFRAAREAIGDEIDAARADRAVRQRHRSSPPRDLPGFAIHAEMCEDVWTPIPPSHLRRDGGRDGAGEPEREQHHDRQGGLPAHALHGAVRAHVLGLHLHRRGPGRVDHRPRVGRAGADLRERRPGRRGRALQPRRAVALRRHRPRPDRLRPRRDEQLRRLDRTTTASACRPSGRSSSSSGSGGRRSRCDARSSASRTSRPTPRRARSAATRSTTSRSTASRRACARPGSRRS